MHTGKRENGCVGESGGIRCVASSDFVLRTYGTSEKWAPVPPTGTYVIYGLNYALCIVGRPIKNATVTKRTLTDAINSGLTPPSASRRKNNYNPYVNRNTNDMNEAGLI